eukprot:1006037_1
MAAVARRGQPFVYNEPVVEHHPSEDAFTVSNVRSFAEFEVEAPSLGYQIVEDGPQSYRVEYTPTADHRVKVTVAGEEIARFVVSASEDLGGIVNADPALLEAAAPIIEVQHTVPGHQFLLKGMTDYAKLKIIAPGLLHTVFQVDGGMIVKYTPTGLHHVQIIYDGAMVDKFELKPKPQTLSADADEEEEKVAEEDEEDAGDEIAPALAAVPHVDHTRIREFEVSNVDDPHLLQIEAPALDFNIMHDGVSTARVSFEKGTAVIPVQVLYRGVPVSGGSFTLVPNDMFASSPPAEATVADTTPEPVEAELAEADLSESELSESELSESELSESEPEEVELEETDLEVTDLEETEPEEEAEPVTNALTLFAGTPSEPIIQEPAVEHNLEGKSFTVCHIPEYSLLKIEAPKLDYKIMRRGDAYRVSYAGTEPVPADVKVSYDGKVVKRGMFCLKPIFHDERDHRAQARRTRRADAHAARPRTMTRHVPAQPANRGMATRDTRRIQVAPAAPVIRDNGTRGMRLISAHMPARRMARTIQPRIEYR